MENAKQTNTLKSQYFKIVNNFYSNYYLRKSPTDSLEISDSTINENHEDLFVIDAADTFATRFLIRFAHITRTH